MRSGFDAGAWLRYMAVAAVVGLITVGLREIIAFALQSDTPSRYGISVFLAYCCGVVLNYAGQARFTFGGRRNPQAAASFALFAVFATFSAALTALVSRLLRYGAAFDEVFGRLGPAAAFAVATLAVSAVSFTLASRYVFNARAGRER